MTSNVTQVLNAIDDGDPQAASQLLPLVYEELRRLATAKMNRESSEQTIQPTALVHEAFMRLVGNERSAQWDNRGHFFAAAAESMRRILIDAARRRNAEKRGGGRVRLDLSGNEAVVNPEDSDTLLALDDALVKLENEDPDLARLVELRYFAGMTVDQTADVLKVSPRTVKRNWAYARAWLQRQIEAEPS